MSEVAEGAEALAEEVVQPVEGAEPATPAVADELDEIIEPTPKPKQTARERIEELNAKYREQEREAQRQRDRADRLEAERAKPEPKDEDPEPDPASYEYGETDARYLKDVAKHAGRQAAREATSQARTEDAGIAAQREQVRGFLGKVPTAFPDGEPAGLKAYKALPSISPAIQDIVLSSEVGPALADHLGAHPDDFERISALPPHRQAYELAKIEDRYTKPASKPIKRAPDLGDPPEPARGKGGKFEIDPATTDFAAFERRADALKAKA